MVPLLPETCEIAGLLFLALLTLLPFLICFYCLLCFPLLFKTQKTEFIVYEPSSDLQNDDLIRLRSCYALGNLTSALYIYNDSSAVSYSYTNVACFCGIDIRRVIFRPEAVQIVTVGRQIVDYTCCYMFTTCRQQLKLEEGGKLDFNKLFRNFCEISTNSLRGIRPPEFRNLLQQLVSWCSWLSHESNTLRVAGSNPAEITLLPKFSVATL